MMRWGLGAIGLAAAGAIAIAALGIGAGASAQTGPEDAPKRGERYRELLAEQLGITVEELEEAQVAARDQVIDEAVEAGDLTEEQAERLKAMEPREFRMGFGPGGRIHHAVVSVFESAADVVGISVEELRERIAAGESLVEIAEAQGITEESLTSDLIAALTDKINQAVTDGDLEQERADKLLENLDELVERAINAEGPFERRFDGPRPGRFLERLIP